MNINKLSDEQCRQIIDEYVAELPNGKLDEILATFREHPQNRHFLNAVAKLAVVAEENGISIDETAQMLAWMGIQMAAGRWKLKQFKLDN